LAKNLTNFMNGVQTQIADLCQGPDPIAEPAKTARLWMRDKISPQPPEMNKWMSGEMEGPAAFPLNLTWTSVGLQGQAYYAQLNSTISTLASQPFDKTWPQDQQDAWLWFNDQLPPPAVDAEGEAPPDVVSWVESVLPQNVVAATGSKVAQSVSP
jgi:hypothetical protein